MPIRRLFSDEINTRHNLVNHDMFEINILSIFKHRVKY